MPPHQTNFTSETGRDAAGLRVAVPAMRDAPGPALADTPVAALRDASPEKQAAGPPIASTWNALRVLLRYWHAFRERRRVESLHNLSDRALMDIGLTRGDVDHFDAHRTTERLRDGTKYLWL